MSTRYLLTTLLFAATVIAAEHQFGVQVGGFQSIMRDEVISPLLYTGRGPEATLSYGKTDDTRSHVVKLGFSFGTTNSSISNLDYLYRYRNASTGELEEDVIQRSEAQLSAIVEYGYYKQFRAGMHHTLSWGGILNYDFHMQFSHFPVITSVLSLCPAINLDYQRSDKGEFSLLAYIPLISHLNRPPWTATDEEIMELAAKNPALIAMRGEIVSMGQHLRLSTNLTYRHSVSHWMDAMISWGAIFTSIPNPKPKSEIENHILLGVNFTIQGR